MHSSSLTLRPRQRTSTSCTECRRRKQKCNQAKDRPCNNCARRYPPVACTYESSSRSRGSTIERVIDLQDGPSSRNVEQPSGSRPMTHPTSSAGTNNASHAGAGRTAFASEEDQLSSTSHPFYAPLDSTTDYWQQDDPWSSQNLAATSSTGSVGYYQSQNDCSYGFCTSFTSAGQSNSGYYTSAEASTGWLSTTGDPGAFVGTGTVYDAFNDLPIDASRRNAELFHFFHQSLAPFLVTIDGKDPPVGFYGEWTPWVVQSRLVSSVTILSASCYQSEVRGLDVAKCPETIAIQGKIISVINKHLREKKLKEVGYDAIAAVMYLAMNEWFFGDDAVFWAHMKGVKEMLRLQGGIERMPENSLLRKQIILTDYQIACSFERDAFLLKDSQSSLGSTAQDAYPKTLENPLLQSEVRFVNIYSTLGISRPSADILDDMKFLTTSILNLQAMSPTLQNLLKVQATALWTHNRVSALPPSPIDTPDLIYDTLRQTALLYSTAILSRQPLSSSSTIALVQELGVTIWRTSLSRWKKIPGILFWIVLVSCPCPNENKTQRKFLRMIVATVAMFIGVENHDVAVACMRSFWNVQRWIEGSDEKELVEGLKVTDKGKLDMGIRSAGRNTRDSVVEK